MTGKKLRTPYSGITHFWGYLLQFFYLINPYSFSCYNPLIVILSHLISGSKRLRAAADYFVSVSSTQSSFFDIILITFLYDFVSKKICTHQTIILIKLIMGMAAFFDMKQHGKLKISMHSYFQLSILWKAIYLGLKISFHQMKS